MSKKVKIKFELRKEKNFIRIHPFDLSQNVSLVKVLSKEQISYIRM